MKQIILGTILAGMLWAPSALVAQDRGHDESHRAERQNSYYDSAHRDRHEWNDNENAAWGRYREEHHVRQSDFARASRRQQQQYWNWRHEHPDQH